MTQQQQRVSVSGGADGAASTQSQDGIGALLSSPTNGGALCNDSLGLCIGSRGTIDTSQSGMYTTIARLAARLGQNDNEDEQDLNRQSRGGEDGTSNAVAPLVTIETDRATLLVKEYEGNAVVFRVPFHP